MSSLTPNEARQLALAAYTQKVAAEPAPVVDNTAIMPWLRKVEGYIPVAKRITNSAGQRESDATAGYGSLLSKDNEPFLKKMWGKDRYNAIVSGSPINEAEAQQAADQHLTNNTDKQLDSWSPSWRKLNPMMQQWLRLHVYSLGNNIHKFKQGRNAVNALAVNPTSANAQKLLTAFQNSQYAKQTGTRLQKMQPLYDAALRQLQIQEARRAATALATPQGVAQ
jgi:hypothetical protein